MNWFIRREGRLCGSREEDCADEETTTNTINIYQIHFNVGNVFLTSQQAIWPREQLSFRGEGMHCQEV